MGKVTCEVMRSWGSHVSTRQTRVLFGLTPIQGSTGTDLKLVRSAFSLLLT